MRWIKASCPYRRALSPHRIQEGCLLTSMILYKPSLCTPGFLFCMLSRIFLTNPPQDLFSFSFASMAPSSQSASWRRADTVRARSDAVGESDVSSGAGMQHFSHVRGIHSPPSLDIASGQQNSSLAGQTASSSLDNPVSSSVTSNVSSLTSNGSAYRYALASRFRVPNTSCPVAYCLVLTSSTAPTSSAVINAAPSSVASIETLSEPFSSGALEIIVPGIH